ncbi:competence CoiA-like predicted nuclease [Anoxybacillus tepidamans]|uniref:Competence CoiA-like predicted nuclease n=1 Tax=Anoxybacteroides tepidamans TaxID=265948 RepID=A0A7W8IRQ7_9BACL|nr:competence protein CoiA family protein [Anoxybacillus tepidamans]MBB5325550.1 competence CoiA-like predicted nuclease [Anoxybacillus tepidamans]
MSERECYLSIITKGSGLLLVALLKNGQSVSLIGSWTREQMMELRKRESFFCPACQNEVILKLGNRRMPHFAHKREGMCPFEHEAESPYHVAGKTDLFHWLKKQSMNVRLEPYFHHVQQRPDLSVMDQDRLYAFEYQCSTMGEALFRKRNDQYKKAGIRPVWILGAHHLQRLSAYRFKLPRFQWLFAQHVSSVSPQPLIFYYCPQTKRLIRLVHLIPFSPYYTFSVPVIEKLDRVRFADFLTYPAVPLPSPFWNEWLAQKKKWRLTFTMYPTLTNRAICFDFYPHHPPALFPCEAGWPLDHSYLFETPAFIWQTYILLFLANDETYSLSSLYAWMKEKIAEQKITVRHLPLAQAYHYTRAVYEYVQWLEQLGYVRWVNRKAVQRIKNWTFPNTIDEALTEDRRLLERMKRKSL